MRRADVVLISKAGLGEADALVGALQARLAGGKGSDGGAAASPPVPVFRCDYKPQRLARLDGGTELPLSALRGRDVFLWCAIAQPGGFQKTVEGLGAKVRALHAFRDHYSYNTRDVAWLDSRLAQGAAGSASVGSVQWVTTGKDAVKLRGRIVHPERLWVLEMEVVPEPAAQAFFFDFLSGLKLR